MTSRAGGTTDGDPRTSAGPEDPDGSVDSGAEMTKIPAGATGIGSMPGSSVVEAVAVIAGELPDLPHVPELPARGAGADLVGRTAALLSRVSEDLAVETEPTGWRLAGAMTRDVRRALWLEEEILDRCEEVFGDSAGNFKLQLCGPWTLAGAIETPRGGPALQDSGLVAEISAALGEAAQAAVAGLARRLPDRRLVLQIDEPLLPAVLRGQVATASGWGKLPALPDEVAAGGLAGVFERVGVPTVLHCCGEFPFDVARAAQFSGVSWDLALTPDPIDAVAEAFESGQHLVIGAVSPLAPGDVATAWDRVVRLMRTMGYSESELAAVSFSPSCGLAGSSPEQARQALGVAAGLAARAAGG